MGCGGLSLQFESHILHHTIACWLRARIGMIRTTCIYLMALCISVLHVTLQSHRHFHAVNNPSIPITPGKCVVGVD